MLSPSLFLPPICPPFHHFNEERRNLLVRHVVEGLDVQGISGAKFQPTSQQHLLVELRERRAAHLQIADTDDGKK